MIFMYFLTAMAMQDAAPPLREHAPAFSPDGSQIAYYSYRNGLPDIYLFDRATGDVQQITDTPDRWEIEPFWAPDGSELYFPSGISMRRLSLHSVDAAEGNARAVPLALPATGPTDVSADGQSIFYFQRHESGDRLWRVDIGGIGHLVTIRLPTGRNASPHATSDGRSLVFSNTAPDADAADIFQLDFATMEYHAVTDTPWDEGYLTLSPDPTSVLFSAEIGGAIRDIFSLPLNGETHRNRPTPLISSSGNTRFFASLSVDGTIAYDEVSDAGGARVWILEPDETTPRLTPELSSADY